jgi:hypothetical protein
VQSADFMCRSDYWCNAGVAQIVALAQALRKYSRLHKNYKVCTKITGSYELGVPLPDLRRAARRARHVDAGYRPLDRLGTLFNVMPQLRHRCHKPMPTVIAL